MIALSTRNMKRGLHNKGGNAFICHKSPQFEVERASVPVLCVILCIVHGHVGPLPLLEEPWIICLHCVDILPMSLGTGIFGERIFFNWLR
jgi:hypothetical protein